MRKGFWGMSHFFKKVKFWMKNEQFYFKTITKQYKIFIKEYSKLVTKQSQKLPSFQLFLDPTEHQGQAKFQGWLRKSLYWHHHMALVHHNHDFFDNPLPNNANRIDTDNEGTAYLDIHNHLQLSEFGLCTLGIFSSWKSSKRMKKVHSYNL